jgi:LPS export ABC transporter permease LptG
MATLVTFAMFSRTSELTAMKASGVSLYRASVPVVLIGVAVSGLCFLLQENVLAYSNRRAAELLDEIKGRPPETYNLLDRRWMLGQNDTVYHYSHFDADRALFSGLAVYGYGRDPFRLRSRAYAREALWDGATRTWRLRQGWRRDFDQGGEVREFEETTATEIEPPDYFVKEEKKAEQMTYGELSDYIADLEQSGFDVTRLKVDRHSKLTFPLAALVTVLIAIPFSLTPGKKGALYGIGIAIAIGLVYYVTTRVFASMGGSGMLPPLMAAWTPNVLFSVAALYGLFTVRT